MNDHREEILELLRMKNRCLDRLMAETRTFLAVDPAKLVAEGVEDHGPLTAYEGARTTILRTIELHDRRISELIAALPPAERTPEFIAGAREEMVQNERLIVAVFNADDIVFRKIADAQIQITKLIQENRKSREILNKFKSASGQTGEEMDQTL